MGIKAGNRKIKEKVVSFGVLDHDQFVHVEMRFAKWKIWIQVVWGHVRSGHVRASDDTNPARGTSIFYKPTQKFSRYKQPDPQKRKKTSRGSTRTMNSDVVPGPIEARHRTPLRPPTGRKTGKTRGDYAICRSKLARSACADLCVYCYQCDRRFCVKYCDLCIFGFITKDLSLTEKMMTRIAGLLVLAAVSLVRGDTSVYILSANLEQVVTSSTLQWVSSSSFNESMLSNAVVAAFQRIEDENDEANDAERKVFVCRAKTNYIWVAGQLRPKKRVCIVSMYKKVSQHDNFEVLINIENAARLSWVYKNQYVTSSPVGGVTSGEGREGALRTFVARRDAKSHNKPSSLTYNVGKFNPSENLGVFDVVDQNNEELKEQDGEILVETEPVSYEIRGVKFDRIRSRHNRKRRVLGHAILKNTEAGLQRVDTVITYNYTYSIYWGKGHGLLTGLNFTVYLRNGTKSGTWAVPKTENTVVSHTIEKFLEEGTAVNVTLYGNYTESDVPYTCTVHAIYKDKEQKSRLLSDSKRENQVIDVVVDFGPVYFLHNNSYVPTTTTTTTTTTSTTTTTTTTTSATTRKVLPHVVRVGNSEKHPEEASAIKIHENSSMQSDASDAAPATTTKASSAAGGRAAVAVMGAALAVLRVT